MTPPTLSADHKIEVLRESSIWAVLLSASFIGRTGLDWFVPTTEFATRATASTWIGVTILLVAGFRGAWKLHSPSGGLFVGVATATIAAALSTIGAGFLIAIWHDARTLDAIQGSGGLGEVFALPFMLILPAALLGIIGGVAGGAARRLTTQRLA
jgi:hypothetical protein